MHYGLSFLDLIKNDGQYGSYFSYEEYQSLKEASDKDSFYRFIKSTKYSDTNVYATPELTYEDFHLLIERGRDKGYPLPDFTGYASGGDDPIGCLLVIFIYPPVFVFTIIASIARNLIMNKKIGRKRAQLKKIARREEASIESNY